MKTERVALDRLRELTPLNGHDGNFTSVPMASTDAAYSLVKDAIVRLLGDSEPYLEDLTAEYAIVRTRAPKDYDYSYCLDIGTVAGDRGQERIIAIPKHSVAYQTARYGSGLYGTVSCD